MLWTTVRKGSRTPSGSALSPVFSMWVPAETCKGQWNRFDCAYQEMRDYRFYPSANASLGSVPVKPRAPHGLPARKRKMQFDEQSRTATLSLSVRMGGMSSCHFLRRSAGASYRT